MARGGPLRGLYYDNGIKKKEFGYEEGLRLVKEGTGLVWMDLDLSKEEGLKRLVSDFGLHPTALEDWSGPRHRARLKDFGSHLFIILNSVNLSESEPALVDLLVIVGKNFVLTLHNTEVDSMKSLYGQTCDTGASMAKGSAYLLFFISDQVVDSFFPAFDVIDGQVAAVENRILADPREKVLNQLLRIKRHCLHMRKSLAPMRDVFATLARLEMPLISGEIRPYFMSVYDHVLRLLDTVENYRDLLSSALEVYLSAQSNKMNEIMKTLTIIATIMMPLTVITGIYGMNFPIPELESKHGYPAVLAAMAAITVGMLFWFKRRKWI